MGTPEPSSPMLAADPDGNGTLLRIKAVPGSSRDRIAGALGDRLKVCVTAPPEDGRANLAVCALIAERLGIAPREVEVVSGHTRPEKTLRIRGRLPAIVRERLEA